MECEDIGDEFCAKFLMPAQISINHPSYRTICCEVIHSKIIDKKNNYEATHFNRF